MSIEGFFHPNSVAVVGASQTNGKVGHEILVNLIRDGFAGAIYPVNPSRDEIEGLRCYPDLVAIGSPPDLTVIVVPTKAVAGVLRQCGQVGCRHAVVVTSGFKEVGPEGLKRERELVQIAREFKIRMIGPNCLGFMAPASKLNVSFGGRLPKPGGIGYFSQSGSLLAAIVDITRASGLGFSRLVSVGNSAEVNELDILRALADDEDTEIIAGYLETITDGDAFIRETERISKRKPILLMKAGETGAGARAASSHTGRLAQTRRVQEVVFERAGIIRCESITAQFDYARALLAQPLPTGVGTAIIANAGGAGIMATDATERLGLKLAELTDATRRRLAEKLPAAANSNNPIDVLGDALADRFEFALTTTLDDPNVHMALVLLTPHAMTQCDETAEAIVRVSRARQAAGEAKPVLACFIGAQCVANAVAILRRGGVPPYPSPEFAVSSMKAMSDYARWRSRPERVVKLFPVNRRKVERIINRCLRSGQKEVGEMEAKSILEAYGFAAPKGFVATNAEQAADFAEMIGYPVVLKIWSPDIVHKAEVGGVRSRLTTAQEVMDAFDLMMYRVPKRAPDASIAGVLVQEMYRSGTEVILGMHRDPRYGPMMMFGMGGVFVEVLRDVAFYLAPLTGEDAKEMLLSTRTYQILKGGQDGQGVDIDAIADGLQRLSQLVTEFPQIQEMDINPFVVGKEGDTPLAVDAHIVIRED